MGALHHSYYWRFKKAKLSQIKLRKKSPDFLWSSDFYFFPGNPDTLSSITFQLFIKSLLSALLRSGTDASFRLSISFSTHSSNNLQDSLIPSETENISFLKICSQTVFLLLTLTLGSTSFHLGLLTFNPFGVTNASFHHPIFFVVQVISYSHFPIFPSLLFPFQLWEFQSPPHSSSFPLRPSRPSHPSPQVSPFSGRKLNFIFT